MNVVDQGTGSAAYRPPWTCPHQPPCPGAEAADRDLALIRVAHPGQGWTLLCNGVITFDDTGELMPDGRTIPPQRSRLRLAM
ncbi:DUF5999 family protein [Catenulispora subtropica]|uniref:Uncharacterized protein n=1 Tax=Catenulispora subtropica TaxID=450798 RepID=A0ABP5CQ82_9ACTN